MPFFFDLIKKINNPSVFCNFRTDTFIVENLATTSREISTFLKETVSPKNVFLKNLMFQV